MRWRGSRQSSNVEDYRGRRTGGGGLKFGGVAVIGLIAAYFLGVDPTLIMSLLGGADTAQMEPAPPGGVQETGAPDERPHPLVEPRDLATQAVERRDQLGIITRSQITVPLKNRPGRAGEVAKGAAEALERAAHLGQPVHGGAQPIERRAGFGRPLGAIPQDLERGPDPRQPLLEAMMSGAPVIASTAASIPEVVGDAALLVDPLDREAWTRTIVDVVNDERKRAHMRSAGLRRAAEFTWSRTARLTLEAYRRAA